ncbi:MAG: hypothetical protein C0619_01065 [Desulfuromonas sp.]|nr:MAG: hypothetical protein C0619_01065 [Desulfuromonas sp.]
MKIKVLFSTLVFSALMILPLSGYAYSENIVASLDGESVTVDILTTYVDEVAGSNYKLWLDDKEGLRKLADFYINRTLLLEYARETVEKNDALVSNHNARSVDEDVMYLTSLLKKEVHDKAMVTQDDVHAYMTERQYVSEKQARQELESDRKNILMTQLIEKVRQGHEISYYY